MPAFMCGLGFVLEAFQLFSFGFSGFGAVGFWTGLLGFGVVCVFVFVFRGLI